MTRKTEVSPALRAFTGLGDPVRIANPVGSAATHSAVVAPLHSAWTWPDSGFFWHPLLPLLELFGSSCFVF